MSEANDTTNRMTKTGEGKAPTRRRGRMTRGFFEDGPGLSAATGGDSRLARRWAENGSPYSPLSHLR